MQPPEPKRMLAAIVSFFLRHVIVALMLAIGLAARPVDLADIWRRPRIYLRALLVMEVGVPLLALATVEVLHLPPLSRALVLLMAVCPGAPLIPLMTRRKGETHSAVGLNLLLLTSILAPITIPVWLMILERIQALGLGIGPRDVFRQVAALVLVPVGAGMILRLALPRVAHRVAQVAHAFFVVALVVAIAAALWVGGPVLLSVPPRVLLAVLVMDLGAVAMGTWAGAPRPEARRVTGVSAALGNPGLVLAIAAASRPGFQAAAFVAAYVIARKLALLPYEVWSKRREVPRRDLAGGVIDDAARLPGAPSRRFVPQSDACAEPSVQ